MLTFGLLKKVGLLHNRVGAIIWTKFKYSQSSDLLNKVCKNNVIDIFFVQLHIEEVFENVILKKAGG
jgi:hypothetical protein